MLVSLASLGKRDGAASQGQPSELTLCQPRRPKLKRRCVAQLANQLGQPLKPFQKVLASFFLPHYKFKFDTPVHASGIFPEDVRQYTFKFDKP